MESVEQQTLGARGKKIDGRFLERLIAESFFVISIPQPEINALQPFPAKILDHLNEQERSWGVIAIMGVIAGAVGIKPAIVNGSDPEDDRSVSRIKNVDAQPALFCIQTQQRAHARGIFKANA